MLSHPSDKSKNVARMGHPAYFNGGWGLFPGPSTAADEGTGDTRCLDPLTFGSSVHTPL
jgi:hypothetical protein